MDLVDAVRKGEALAAERVQAPHPTVAALAQERALRAQGRSQQMQARFPRPPTPVAHSEAQFVIFPKGCCDRTAVAWHRTTSRPTSQRIIVSASPYS